MGFIKHFVTKCRERSHEETTSGLAAPSSSMPDKSTEEATSATPQSSVQDTPIENPTPSSMFTYPEIPENKELASEYSGVTPGSPKVVGEQAKTGTKQISMKALKFAIKRCQKFLAENDHDDIDILDNVSENQNDFRSTLILSALISPFISSFKI